MPKVERIDTARMDRLERVELDRHESVLERLDEIADRIDRLESVASLVLAHVSTARVGRLD
ncbi:hypothetical protein PPGU19_001390 [Paraburkholderia sp. PGU19]|uniref:hypothetical protein n=1 Tax=Paraburkholderia sp. PGU19 TaxID=2735434 RepID=UPI0015D9B4FE|nr:hypothetical protein [Paraburkholderia sp. PGU19]BCF95570.1 hypothetical protein PPGU19_001390 [Paraburkholderia sp. PGU19]